MSGHFEYLLSSRGGCAPPSELHDKLRDGQKWGWIALRSIVTCRETCLFFVEVFYGNVVRYALEVPTISSPRCNTIHLASRYGISSFMANSRTHGRQPRHERQVSGVCSRCLLQVKNLGLTLSARTWLHRHLRRRTLVAGDMGIL